MQAAALALTQELCSSRHACLALVESGAASPLAGMLSSGAMANTEVAAATLGSLQALAAAGLPQTQVSVSVRVSVRVRVGFRVRVNLTGLT